MIDEERIDRLSYELDDLTSNLHICRDSIEKNPGGKVYSEALYVLEKGLMRIASEMREAEKKEA